MIHCAFVSHSVMRHSDGTLIDITPAGPLAQADLYPFLPAGMSEDEYINLATKLYLTTGDGNLDWRHTSA